MAELDAEEWATINQWLHPRIKMRHMSFTTASGDLVVVFVDTSGQVAVMLNSRQDNTSTFLNFNSVQELTELGSKFQQVSTG